MSVSHVRHSAPNHVAMTPSHTRGRRTNLQLHFRAGGGRPAGLWVSRIAWVTRRYLRKLIRDHGAAGLA
jgi:hypothetical protein